MIDVRPLNPVHKVGDPDTRSGRFYDSEWRNLIELAQRYGFEPPDEQIYYPQAYDQPIEIDAETSQGLWEATSAVYNDETHPYASIVEESNISGSPIAPSDSPLAHPELHIGKALVRRLVECAQIGAKYGGIEIRRAREED